jgi:hypothetical protein
MMLRDHFGKCGAMPSAVQEKFLALKKKPAQGATDSKQYWIYSAMKKGMADSPHGIIATELTLAVGMKSPPFGNNPGDARDDGNFKNVSLVTAADTGLAPEFFSVLLTHAQIVRMLESERVGNRRSLEAGLPGFACRYCCDHGRLGNCRMFPVRRRSLPAKVLDLYEHLLRCTVCPVFVKEQLKLLFRQIRSDGPALDGGPDRVFFDRLWNRILVQSSGKLVDSA